MRTVRPRSRHRGRTGRPWCSATRSSSSVLRVLAHRALPLQDFITLHPEHIARNNALGPMSDDGGRSITGAIVRACFSLLARSINELAARPRRCSAEKVPASPSAGAALHRHASPLPVHVRICPRAHRRTYLAA
ncbi:hypothetical protein B0H17DRAFT_1340001 [Mycena rosella]|uniref:Uncharacterized protein n=1 Tax=Mycena rosella TaxID=1033263 RepID=A0AAD7BSL5_MYCRO|nr:hypothetical protein B0H17DRAFT_1340001 [Mycena rosella]